ncbi:uncharacterized protein LOC128712806 [Anopheles marshallii]|uniref:uncharacterized protein LOC128712806 n=1 Tax=Anopheles marshallii TaxID=1521116 RepID=UPI00237B7B38|nr:uncharacterized protein LOC128712806 [Anopheles marshallii]
MADESCVKWTNFQEHLVRAVNEIFVSHQYTDCRLVVPEGELCANRAVLCMASKFFEAIFAGTMTSSVIATDHLTILIPDLQLSCLRCVLQFIYTGEVYLRPHDVAPFVEACSLLQIRGAPYSDDRSVENNFGTFINSMQDGLIADSGGNETATYLSHDCEREVVSELSVAEQSEQSNTLTVQNESVEFDCQQVSFGEKSIDGSFSPDYEMENGDRNATIQDLLHEGLEDRLNEGAKSESSEHLDPSSYETRLNAAIDAILNRNISYRVASQQYKIAKTVLWRRTMKMPRLVRPTSPKLANQRREAIDALKSGEKLVHVSQRFEIPLSTLHRDKIRLYKKGILPSKVTLKQRDKGESFRQRLTEAVNECIAGRMSLSEAARVYELPKTSIWRKVRSSQPSNSTSGKEMEENVAKCDHAVRSLDRCVGTVLADAEHTVGDLLSVTYQSMDVSASELTQDAIIL